MEERIEKRWLNVVETAQYIGISPRTIYNSTGPKSKKPFIIKPKRIGKRLLFDVRKLEAFMEQ